MTIRSLLPKRLRKEDIEHPLARMQREMNRLFESFLGPESPEFRANWLPTVDMSESENDVVVKADMPGLAKDDISVTISGNVLTISGERKDEREETKGTYSVHERSYGKFQRSVTLPAGVDADKAGAEFKDGVLTVKVPKTEETRAKKIPIKAEKELAEARK